MKPITLLSILLVLCINIHAQTPGKYEIGINPGAGVYLGDLTPTPIGSYKTIKPTIGVQGTRILNNTFSVRLNLSRTWLKGDDGKYENPEWRQYRNFRFKSPATEISGLFVWNVMGRNLNEVGIFNFSPYIMCGVGYSFLKVRKDYSDFDFSHFGNESSILDGLAADDAHGNPRGIPVIPLGIGFRLGISPKFSFAAESMYRFTFTDYLDGFSEAANPRKKDAYQTHTVGLIYTFGKNNKDLDCPPIP